MILIAIAMLVGFLTMCAAIYFAMPYLLRQNGEIDPSP
jgi:hypothetical protein